MSRNTVRKYLREASVEPDYPTRRSPSKLDAYDARLTQWLTHDQALPRKQRRTATRLFEGLKADGFDGSYDRVCYRFAISRAVGRYQLPTGSIFPTSPP